MTADREDFLPAAAPAQAIPPAVRASLKSLSRELASLAALLAQHAREEEARRASRRRRRGRERP